MATTAHEVRVPQSLKDRVGRYAHKNWSSSSAVLREFFEGYADGKPSRTVAASEPDVTTVRFLLRDETWEQARKRAIQEGVSLSQVARDYLAQLEDPDE